MFRAKHKIVGAQCIFYQTLQGRDGDNTIGILLQKRNHRAKIYPGYWACFGGSVEEGETPMECLEREIEEEIGLNRYGFDKFLLEVPIWREEKGMSMMFYSCRILEVIEIIGEESLGYALFNPEEINHILLRPEDRAAIAYFLKEMGT